MQKSAVHLGKANDSSGSLTKKIVFFDSDHLADFKDRLWKMLRMINSLIRFLARYWRLTRFHHKTKGRAFTKRTLDGKF